jgi:hypothetical protein
VLLLPEDDLLLPLERPPEDLLEPDELLDPDDLPELLRVVLLVLLDLEGLEDFVSFLALLPDDLLLLRLDFPLLLFLESFVERAEEPEFVVLFLAEEELFLADEELLRPVDDPARLFFSVSLRLFSLRASRSWTRLSRSEPVFTRPEPPSFADPDDLFL